MGFQPPEDESRQLPHSAELRSLLCWRASFCEWPCVTAIPGSKVHGDHGTGGGEERPNFPSPSPKDQSWRLGDGDPAANQWAWSRWSFPMVAP